MEYKKGPWKCQPQETCRDWYEILSLNSPGMDIARVAPWSGSVKANAHLISAAPDLLEALEAIAEGCAFPEDDVQSAILKRARAAIAKARGQS